MSVTLGHRRLLTADHGRPEVAEASPALSRRCRARPPPLVLPVSLRDDCDKLVSVAEKRPGRYLQLEMSDVAWPGGPPTSTASPQPPPPRPTWRDRLRTIGFVALAVLWVALRIVFRIALEPEDPPVAETPVAFMGTFVRTLPAGTCFIEAYPADFVRPTPCTERHGSELVALLTYPSPPGEAFPPVQEAFRVALALCETAFNAFVGGTADRTPARSFVALPRAGDWRGGERLVVCFANGRNGVELTNSVRASAAIAGR